MAFREWLNTTVGLPEIDALFHDGRSSLTMISLKQIVLIITPFVLLGNIQTGDGFEPEAGKRYVFAYLGTGAIPLRTVQSVLPQLFPVNGNYICLVAAQSVSVVERIGAVEFHSYVPAAEVMSHCDWTICHGGQNTIIQSLVNGVPLMIFPGPIFERRFNARKIHVTGAGLMGESNEFTPKWIEATLEKQSACAERAKELGEMIRSYGGAIAAVEAMEQWSKQQRSHRGGGNPIRSQ